MLDLLEIKEQLSRATILDCTLRDGGYVNDWKFSKETAEKLMFSLSLAGIREVEVGFRTNKNSQHHGPHAFSTDHYLEGLLIPSELSLWVMVNASDLLGQDDPGEVEQLFKKASESPVSGVRVACLPKDLNLIQEATTKLSTLGYRVSINLMQAANSSLEDIDALAATGKRSQAEVVYLADTSGSMSPASVQRLTEELSQRWLGKIGFHAHDNLGLALINSVTAMKSGATYVDSTISGMGRGAGNLRTEEVLSHIMRSEYPHLLGPLYDMAINGLPSSKSATTWGYNPFFVLSGLSKIHPDYAIETIEFPPQTSEAGIVSLSRIPSRATNKYNKNMIEDTLSLDSPKESTNLEFIGRHSGLERAILVGPGLKPEDCIAVTGFAEINKIPIFALNKEGLCLEDKLSGRFFANLTKFIDAGQFFVDLSKAPIIAPFDRLSSANKSLAILKSKAQHGMVLYGLYEPNNERKISWNKQNCVIERPLTFPYALSYLATAGVKEIYLAGFDGFSGTDSKKKIPSQSAIESYESGFGGIVFSLTPTEYQVAYVSPHGPIPRRDSQ